MTNITIPREALKKARDKLALEKGCQKCRMSSVEYCACYREARAACFAMIKAWPGMSVTDSVFNSPMGGQHRNIILPLTENSNDKG